VIDVAVPGGKELWTGTTGLDPDAAITGSFVIIRDSDARTLRVLRRGGLGVKLEVSTRADVVGFGANSIVLGSARSIGYHAVSA
jgi:hypothetical protein